MMSKRLVLAWLLWLSLLLPQAAVAANLTISSCVLTKPLDMAFKTTLNETRGAATTFQVSCKTLSDNSGKSASATFSIALSAGASGSTLQRTMSTGESSLTYNLYQDAALSIVWSNNYTQTITGDISNQLFTIYGRIDKSSDNLAKPAGSYSDPLIVATISW